MCDVRMDSGNALKCRHVLWIVTEILDDLIYSYFLSESVRANKGRRIATSFVIIFPLVSWQGNGRYVVHNVTDLTCFGR
jgi:hypothetical protein